MARETSNMTHAWGQRHLAAKFRFPFQPQGCHNHYGSEKSRNEVAVLLLEPLNTGGFHLQPDDGHTYLSSMVELGNGGRSGVSVRR